MNSRHHRQPTQKEPIEEIADPGHDNCLGHNIKHISLHPLQHGFHPCGIRHWI